MANEKPLMTGLFPDRESAELGNKAAEGAGVGGALVGWNMPEERVKEYDEGIRNGGILMGVRPRNDEDANHLSTALKANRAQNVYS